MQCEDRGRSDRAASQGHRGLGHPPQAGGGEEDQSLEPLEEHGPADAAITSRNVRQYTPDMSRFPAAVHCAGTLGDFTWCPQSEVGNT